MTAANLLAVGCSQGGQEAGLEAIRMVLADNQGADLKPACTAATSLADCVLSWRQNTTDTPVKKMIIMATDEDSDRPTNP